MKRVPLEQVGRIRMTPDKMPSLVDVGSSLMNTSSNDAGTVLRRMFERYPDLNQKICRVSFGGRGNRETPVPKDVAALIEIIFLLPGRAAAQVRQSAAQIFVRYLGGDLTLVQEVQLQSHVQNFLRESVPEHPMRTFGEAVENSELKRKREEADSVGEKCTGVSISEASQKHCGPSVVFRPQPLPELCLNWLKDFDVSRQDLAGVKTQFKAICQVEVSAGRLPERSPIEAWAKAPPLRLRVLAYGAVESFRSLLERRYMYIGTNSTPGTDSSTRMGAHVQNSDENSGEEDDVLKISEIMRAAGVWKAVWDSFRSDLANQMLSLKCAETDGSFSDHRPETVRGHIPVLVHKYRKSTDWPLAWTALQNTRDLYEKRVREFLEDMFHLSGQSEQTMGQSLIDLARGIAASLRVTA